MASSGRQEDPAWLLSPAAKAGGPGLLTLLGVTRGAILLHSTLM